jgi:hypothetical protein
MADRLSAPLTKMSPRKREELRLPSATSPYHYFNRETGFLAVHDEGADRALS